MLWNIHISYSFKLNFVSNFILVVPTNLILEVVVFLIYPLDSGEHYL